MISRYLPVSGHGSVPPNVSSVAFTEQVLRPSQLSTHITWFDTIQWLYNACILPIFLYGSDIWYVTSTLSKKIDALDKWWTDFVSNDEVRSRTGQPFLSDTILGRRLSFFGHLSRVDPSQDHSRALQSCILGPPITGVAELADRDVRPPLDTPLKCSTPAFSAPPVKVK